MTWAVFLDRDGVINEEVGLVSRPEQLRIIPKVTWAITRLRDAGALVIVATNQSVVARGLTDEHGLERIHRRLQEQLATEGAMVDAIYYCPHHPETHHPEANNPLYRRECECRKPKPGMLLRAARDLQIDLSRSFMIGDSTRDLEAARRVGCRAILVQSGHGGQDGLFPVRPHAVCKDLSDATDWVLGVVRGTT